MFIMTGFLSTKTRQLNYLHQFKKDKWKNEIKRKLALREKCPFWSYSGLPYFPAFGLNKERYGVRIHSQCGIAQAK